MTFTQEYDLLLQHDECPNKSSHSSLGNCNRHEEDDARCGEVEEDKCQKELPEPGKCWDKANKTVHNASVHQCWDDTQWNHIEENLYRVSDEDGLLLSQPWM